MILAKKSGWMILVTEIRKTRSGTYVEAVDTPGREIWVSNQDTSQRLVNSTDEAFDFITAARKETQ